MPRRSKDWNQSLSRDLRNAEFAKQFICGAIDEGLPLQLVLAKVIRAYGIQEFAKKIKMAAPNVLRSLDPRHNPTLETLNRLLRPFGLRVSVAAIDKRPQHRKHAA